MCGDSVTSQRCSISLTRGTEEAAAVLSLKTVSSVTGKVTINLKNQKLEDRMKAGNECSPNRLFNSVKHILSEEINGVSESKSKTGLDTTEANSDLNLIMAHRTRQWLALLCLPRVWTLDRTTVVMRMWSSTSRTSIARRIHGSMVQRIW